MRIAIVAEVFLPKIDGVVHRTLNLIEQLRGYGDDVLVLCPFAEGSRDCAVPVVTFRSFPFLTYPEYRIGLPDGKLLAALRDWDPDVVHYVNPLAFGFRGYDRLRRAGYDKPSVFSFHTLYGEFVKGYPGIRFLSGIVWWLMRCYHNRADMNMTVSGLMQQELIERRFERVELWPPAVDVALFHPGRRSDAMRARLLGAETGKQLLLTVSRLAPEKNVAFLLGVMERFPEARLAIVGDGPQRAELERRFAKVGAHFIGYLTGEELAQAYASCDAFVYASETETMGNVVLEAMAAGAPVVVPRAGGIPSLVDHDVTGLLYTPRDTEDAVACLRKVLDDERERRRLGDGAYAVVKGWDWHHAIGRVREIYKETIERHPVKGGGTTFEQRVAGWMVTGLVRGFNLFGRARG